MKFVCNILFLVIAASASAQKVVNYEDILIEIKSSKRTLCMNLIIPTEDFSIGIYTEDWEVEDLTMEQCGDIKTDSIKNSKLIYLLESEQYLENLYLNIENNTYENIRSFDTFNWNDSKMVLNLILYKESKEFYDIFIPIKSKKQSKKLIRSISKLLKNDYCFKKLKRNL
ncbi:hypothetical protein [Dokdonia sp. R86516]|uniref:hypothetical protein n=1 Tax=Dokdonia sp. R86516 TaxID=3093856 RepID=UPI0037C66B4B